ncbi:argininosuccinate lyase [Rhodococcus sp. SBT000017]|uniref:argininosuccinate lyase n=1 Tax=Rhodococcus sp. SBT000017 TaxID=1803385 RepID=UPI000EF89C0B|nr:argininosuccinate lyase [Rhodococcus sp. SBT000017]RMB69742.1 argininosuccinate lyase [Rhodococcus sp. SBT000017]
MSEKLWGGRFSTDITDDVLRYTETASVDSRMLEHDLWQNIAHVLMLGRAGINTEPDTKALLAGLLDMESSRADGGLQLDVRQEDVHLNTEFMLIERIGPVGGRMHTARSRNDQVQTDARMVTREWLLDASEELLMFAQDLLGCPESEREAVLPGYTHSQAAQPISVAFWKAAHAQALLRDASRLMDAWKRININPLGACALAGTTFALDRDYTSRLLGFDAPMVNALDATSTRDWTVEVAGAAASGAVNLSRMQEEIVTWSSNEYALAEVHDSFATGSSIMPQKKNPVVAELARGKSGRAVGALVQLLVMEKSVGLGYSCDLQEDKPVYWGALDTYLDTIRLCRRQNLHTAFDGARGRALCWDNFSTATEIANILVSRFDVPFRTAHRITGDLVNAALEAGHTLRNVAFTTTFLREEHDIDISEVDMKQICDPLHTLRSYISAGSTGPTRVAEQQEQGLADVTDRLSEIRQARTRLWEAKAECLRAARSVVGGVSVPEPAMEVGV